MEFFCDRRGSHWPVSRIQEIHPVQEGTSHEDTGIRIVTMIDGPNVEIEDIVFREIVDPNFGRLV